MSKFTPVHYARTQETVNKWTEQFTGTAVEMSDAAAAEANAMFDNTGVKYVKVADGAAAAPAKSKDSVAAGGGSNTDNYVKVNGEVITNQPVEKLFITAEILNGYQWPAGVGIGDMVKVAASGYVYVLQKAKAPEAENQFQKLANTPMPRGIQGDGDGGKTGAEGDGKPLAPAAPTTPAEPATPALAGEGATGAAPAAEATNEQTKA